MGSREDFTVRGLLKWRVLDLGFRRWRRLRVVVGERKEEEGDGMREKTVTIFSPTV